MSIYKEFIPLKPAEVENTVRGLTPGRAIVVHNQEPQIVQIRLRHTFHAGATPSMLLVEKPDLRKVDEALLNELREMLTDDSQPNLVVVTDDVVALRAMVVSLEMDNADLRALNARLRKKLTLVNTIDLPSRDDNDRNNSSRKHKRREAICLACGKPLKGRRDKKYCDDACRKAGNRNSAAPIVHRFVSG